MGSGSGEPRITVRSASSEDRATATALIASGSVRAPLSLSLLRTGQGLLWVAVEQRTPFGVEQEAREVRAQAAGSDEAAADAQEQLVGLLLAMVQVGNEGEALVGYIQELLVHPAYRRLGVAMHLLDAAERYFLDEHTFDRIELATSPENDAALRLYRSRGYTIHQVRISKSLSSRGRPESPGRLSS